MFKLGPKFWAWVNKLPPLAIVSENVAILFVILEISFLVRKSLFLSVVWLAYSVKVPSYVFTLTKPFSSALSFVGSK